MWIVMTRCAAMPSSCGYPYRRVAIVKLDQYHTSHDIEPKMISTHARGVLRVRDFGNFPANGKTPRSGLQRALINAQTACDRLNNEGDLATIEDLIGAGGSA